MPLFVDVTIYVNSMPQSIFHSRNYVFDGDMVAIILYVLSVVDAVIIRLNQASQPASKTILDLHAQSINNG